MLLSTVIYPLEIAFQDKQQTITLRSEYFDDLRTVYMDGRDHPDSSERFIAGHSIGRWEEDVLVVDTNNFAVDLAKVSLCIGRKISADEFGFVDNALPFDNLDVNFSTDDAILGP